MAIQHPPVTPEGTPAAETTFSVTGFDPFEPRRKLAAEQGIVAGATPEGACKDAEIALLAVRDQGQAESALFGEDGVLESLRPGSPVTPRRRLRSMRPGPPSTSSAGRCWVNTWAGFASRTWGVSSAAAVGDCGSPPARGALPSRTALPPAPRRSRAGALLRCPHQWPTSVPSAASRP